MLPEIKAEKFSNALKYAASKWWCGLIVIVIFFIPSYTQIPYDSQSAPKVVAEVLQNPLAYQIPVIFAFIKIVFIILLVGVLLKNERIAQFFQIYILFLFAAVSLFQNMASTQSYGFAFLAGNFILILMVVIAWLIQIFSSQENMIGNKIGKHRYWLILLALLAFWFPVDNTGMNPEFTLTELVFNESMVTFCMITPVVLVSALLLSDKINLMTLKTTGFIGAVFGMMNIITWFILNSEMRWMGILHLPLLIVSLYTFFVVKREMKTMSLK